MLSSFHINKLLYKYFKSLFSKYTAVSSSSNIKSSKSIGALIEVPLAETPIVQNSPILYAESLNASQNIGRIANDVSVEMQSEGTNQNNSNQRTSSLSALRYTRDIIERRATEQTRNWRDNLNNVFMEIRPLVQQAQSVNNSTILSTLLPTNNRSISIESPHISRNNIESFIINFDNIQQNEGDNRLNNNIQNSSSPEPLHHHHFQNHVPMQGHPGQHLLAHIAASPERDMVTSSISAIGGETTGTSAGRDTPNVENSNRPFHHHHHHNHHHENQNTGQNPDGTNQGLVNDAFAQVF